MCPNPHTKNPGAAFSEHVWHQSEYRSLGLGVAGIGADLGENRGQGRGTRRKEVSLLYREALRDYEV